MSNPAPDLETLYDLETAIETAAQKILAEDSIPAFTQQQVDDLPATYVNVQLRVGQVQGNMAQVTPGQWAFRAWNAMLGFEIWTPRRRQTLDGTPDGSPNPEYNPAEHSRFRAQVRRAIQYFSARFDETVLPYHTLTKIEERDTMPSVVVDDDADRSQITCDVIISIRTGAWPVS